jgi:hypothetical protein
MQIRLHAQTNWLFFALLVLHCLLLARARLPLLAIDLAVSLYHHHQTSKDSPSSAKDCPLSSNDSPSLGIWNLFAREAPHSWLLIAFLTLSPRTVLLHYIPLIASTSAKLLLLRREGGLKREALLWGLLKVQAVGEVVTVGEATLEAIFIGREGRGGLCFLWLWLLTKWLTHQPTGELLTLASAPENKYSPLPFVPQKYYF